MTETPWWQSWWAITIGVLLLLIFGFAVNSDPPVESVAAEIVTEVRTVTEEVPANADQVAEMDERDAMLWDWQRTLEDREAKLDRRQRRLDRREAEITGAEAEVAANSFADGTYFVNDDIEPGTYRTDGGSGCYWARLSGVGGGLGDIIANGNTSGPEIVEIASSDAAFETTGGCEWTRQ